MTVGKYSGYYLMGTNFPRGTFDSHFYPISKCRTRSRPFFLLAGSLCLNISDRLVREMLMKIRVASYNVEEPNNTEDTKNLKKFKYDKAIYY